MNKTISLKLVRGGGVSKFIVKVQSTFVRITGIDLLLRASRLESGEPDAKKKRYGHQCQSHATKAYHFF
jgi:hypothetical protein